MTEFNGFGSHLLCLVFRVKTTKTRLMLEEGWSPVEQTSQGMIFEHHFKSRKCGDDETALFELGHALPTGIDLADFIVFWNRSRY